MAHHLERVRHEIKTTHDRDDRTALIGGSWAWLAQCPMRNIGIPIWPQQPAEPGVLSGERAACRHSEEATFPLGHDQGRLWSCPL
jgi:hypothetical protein